MIDWPRIETAFLVALAEHGITPDVGEVLLWGIPRLGVPPGALRKAITAAVNAQGIVTPSGDETRSGSVERSEIERGPEQTSEVTPDA